MWIGPVDLQCEQVYLMHNLNDLNRSSCRRLPSFHSWVQKLLSFRSKLTSTTSYFCPIPYTHNMTKKKSRKRCWVALRDKRLNEDSSSIFWEEDSKEVSHCFHRRKSIKKRRYNASTPDRTVLILGPRSLSTAILHVKTYRRTSS